MTSIDYAANIERADKSGGVNAAYDEFKHEVDSINKNFAPGEREKQLSELTSQLNAAGVLPEISLRWAQDHRFEITQAGQFSRADLTNFKKGNDAVSTAMADALLSQYDELRKKHGDFGMFPHGLDLTRDWFGYEAISKSDLNNAVNELQGTHDARVKDYNIGKSAGLLARSIDAENGGDDFFNRLAKCDGDGDGISYTDVSRMIQADKLMGGELSEAERKIVQTLHEDWTEPYVQKLLNEKGQISLDTLKTNKEVLTAAEAREAGESSGGAHLNGEGFMAGIAGGIETAARAVADVMQQQEHVEVLPGDGFDRIARRALIKHGVQPTEAQVITYARQIAELNEMNRESTILMTGDKLRLPKIAS